MSIYKGSNKICDLYYHGVPVAEIYKGNILVFTKAAAEYFVTITQAANGTISAAPMQGPAGTLVTLSNSPSTGYQLTYYTVNGNQIQGNTFTLDSDSTISGQFTAITYTVTIGSHTNGSLSANPMSGTYGTTVTLTGTPNTHYELDYYSVNGSRITGNTFSLTQNSTVAATYKQKTYTVTIGSHTNGSLSASPSSGVYGTTVTLSGTPNSGYVLDYYTVGGSRITGNTFTLSGNTTVTAVYKQATISVLWLSRFTSGDASNGWATECDNIGVRLGKNINSSTWTNFNSRIKTLAAGDISGIMPSTYVGTKYIRRGFGSTEIGGSFEQSAYLPTSTTKWTVAFWARNIGTANPTPLNYADLPSNWSSDKSSSNNVYIRVEKNQNISITPATSTWPYELYNGTTYNSSSSYYWYTIPCGVGKVWHYCQVVYDANDTIKGGSTTYTGTMTYYVNGKKYLRVAHKDGYYTSYSNPFARTSLNQGSGVRGAILTMRSPDSSPASDICELVVYPGEYLTIPSGPINPA